MRVRVFSGSNLNFVFNSMSEYTGGITYLNHTLLGIEATEGAPTNRTGWEITVRAEDGNGDNLLNGSVPANTLPLGNIEVQATSIAICTPNPAVMPCPVDLMGSPWVPLSNVSTLLVGSNALGLTPDVPPELDYNTTQINISFRCGVGGTMLGEAADYYADEIWLDIDFL